MSLRAEFVRALELLPSLGESPVVLEIGSHQGDGVNAILEACPKASVCAVEADPSNHAKLMANVPRHVDIRILAIGSVTGTVRVNCYSGKDSRNSSLYSEVGKVRKTKGKVEMVTSSKLDDFCDGIGLSPDFIRFDCYGAEYEIFWYGVPEAVKKAKMVLLTMHCKKGLFDGKVYKGIRKNIWEQMELAGFRIKKYTARHHKHQFVLWAKE